jgi:hypothetical protein
MGLTTPRHKKISTLKILQRVSDCDRHFGMIHAIQNGYEVGNLEYEEYKASLCISSLIAKYSCKRISKDFVRFVAVQEVRWE